MVLDFLAVDNYDFTRKIVKIFCFVFRYVTDSDSAIHSEEDTSKSDKKRKNTEMDDSVISASSASPSKKKRKSNVSFETSTPVVTEPEKSSSKKKKKKDKEKEKPAAPTEADMRDALLSNLSFMKSKPKKKSK